MKSPSALRLIATGAAVGLVLAVKHTGLLVLPILFLLVLCEVVFKKSTLKLFGSLALIALIGWLVLWSTYRFRYDARPIQTQLALGDILLQMGQPQQARTSYGKALELAKTIEPEFQVRSLPDIEQRLQSLAGAER